MWLPPLVHAVSKVLSDLPREKVHFLLAVTNEALARGQTPAARDFVFFAAAGWTRLAGPSGLFIGQAKGTANDTLGGGNALAVAPSFQST